MSNESRMLHASTEARILKILAEQGAVCPPKGIHPQHDLETDLHFDSLDCLEVMMHIEEEFGIRLDDELFDQLKTVQQVIDHVAGVCTANEAQVAA